MINKQLQKQIIQMAKEDQAMRKSGKWDNKIDKKNTKRLKTITKKYDWPDFILVGRRASNCAWLIAQHADHDIKFQERCLMLMKQKSKTVNLFNIAYLIDRIKVNRKQSQIYGTQFHLDKHGRLIPWPILNKNNLARRRREMGLQPFSKYKTILQKRQKIIQKTEQ